MGEIVYLLIYSSVVPEHEKHPRNVHSRLLSKLPQRGCPRVFWVAFPKMYSFKVFMSCA